jgi:6-phosphogluconolactonase (cycloisomerase 2 family)
VGASNVTNVSIICTSSPGRFAFFAGGFHVAPGGVVAAFLIDAESGALVAAGQTIINATTMAYPLISISPNGKFAYVTNISSGNLSVFSISDSSGALIETALSPITIQIPTFAGTLTFNSAGTLAYYVANSKINAYVIDSATGIPSVSTLAAVPAGNSRTVAIDALNHFAYAVDTIANKIYAYSIDSASGALTAIAGSPFAGGTGAITINPSGTVCYLPDSTAKTISAYAIDGNLGTLTPISGSPFATSGDVISVAIAPSDAFVYALNFAAQTIDVFAVDAGSGALSPLGSSYQATTGITPNSFVIHPSGKFAYVPAAFDDGLMDIGGVSEFSINSTTGVLTPIIGSPNANISVFNIVNLAIAK